MNRLAVITAFLGGVKNRYIPYKPDRTLEEKFASAAQIERLDGLELWYPSDFGDVELLKSLLADRIDRQQIAAIMESRNSVRAVRYLYDTVLD
jgi:hypothetical protein